MKFVYWLSENQEFVFWSIVFLIIIIGVIFRRDEVENPFLLIMGLCFLLLLIFLLGYVLSFDPKKDLSKEDYIEFRVYQAEQKHKEKLEAERARQEKIKEQKQIELEIQKRLEEKGINEPKDFINKDKK